MVGPKLECPRCKQHILDIHCYGESSLYMANHIICEPCFHVEDDEIESLGTNNLPETLTSYGPSNRWEVEHAVYLAGIRRY